MDNGLMKMFEDVHNEWLRLDGDFLPHDHRHLRPQIAPFI
jgi:hypothetical protein